MPYASLMVYVEADMRPEQRVRVAASLADRFSAALIGVSALAAPPPIVAGGMLIDGMTASCPWRITTAIEVIAH
jgi:hypothetical protein